MGKARKTEILDQYLGEAFQKIVDDYKGEIKFVSDADFNTGRIVIKVKD